MGKKKHKKHAHQRTQAKRKGAPISNNLPHKGNFGAAVSHALSNGWVQNSGVSFLLVLAALVAAIMTSTQVKAAAITFALSGTLFLWIAATVVIRYANESKEPELIFSILQSWFDGRANPNGGMFWIRYPSGLGDTLSPASAALYITIKNPRTSPVRIERLELDVQKKGERWVSLRFIPTQGSRLYTIFGDLTKATLIEVQTLDKQIYLSIPAGETVPGGWVFWSLTKAVPLSEGDEIRWRFQAIDSGGEQSEYVSPYFPWSNTSKFDTGLKQPILIKPLRVDDLSNLIRRNYEPLSTSN